MSTNGKPDGATAQTAQNPGHSGGEARERERLLDTLSDWTFLWPEAVDANMAARTELGLNCATYHSAMLGRVALRGSYIIVAHDTPDGRRQAQAVAEACHKNHAAAARIWPLDGYGSGEFPDFERWSAGNNLDRAVAIFEPWHELKRPKSQESHADALLRIAQAIELFRTPEGDAFATVSLKGRAEHYPIPSEAIKKWLKHAYWLETGRGPSGESIESALGILDARAMCEETVPVLTTSLRVGAEPGPSRSPVWYLDLADDARNLVKIRPGAWELAGDAPIRFRRPRGIGALAVPERGGSLGSLRDFLTVTDHDWLLTIAAVTSYFSPIGPYPVAVVTGEQGSAKTTTTRLIKRLVDPRAQLAGAAPKELRDLMVTAKSCWVIALDNLSGLPVWLSDALSRLSTGGGFSTRKMYSDDEETIIDACRPVVLNSIEDVANRADLLDRAVVISCRPIPEELRREEREFWGAFEAAYPKLLGSILDAVAGGLAMLPLVKLAELPRMADFARWGEAVCRALGYKEGDFLEAYLGNREAAGASVLEDSPIAAELLEFKVAGETWTGTCKTLLTELGERVEKSVRESKRWPKGPRSLSAHLRRIGGALRKNGVDVVFSESHGRDRAFTIVWTEPRGG
jgi:hypothetical protein